MASREVGQRLDVLKDAVGIRRFVLAPLVVAIVGFVDWVIARLSEVGMGNLIGVPSWAIGVFAAHLLITFWLVEYAVGLNKRIRGTRVGLSELRHEGVKLRNDGRRPLRSREEWQSWKARVEKWNDDVIAKIKETNEADAIWFSVLDIVPPPRLPIAQGNMGETLVEMEWKGDREFLYAMHDQRVARLGEMIRELWRDT